MSSHKLMSEDAGVSTPSHSDCHIVVDVSGLSRERVNQIHGIVDRLHDAEAYSIHYYNKASTWKTVYWIVGILAPFAAQAAGIINIIFDQCNDATRKWNAVLSFILGSILMIFTFLRADGRRQTFENAGDEYKGLVRTRVRGIFRSEQAPGDIDYDDHLSTLETEMLYLSKLYPEPGVATLKNIKKAVNLNIVIEGDGSATHGPGLVV